MKHIIKFLIIHCLATPEGRQVSKSDIERWHLVERGWSKTGYRDMIDIKANLVSLNPWNTDEFIDPWEITNGAKGLNGIAAHLAYAGGLDKDTFTPKDTRTDAQKAAMEVYVKLYIKIWPDIKIGGHNQFNNYKACPSFDVPTWLEEIGINECNIYRNND